MHHPGIHAGGVYVGLVRLVEQVEQAGGNFVVNLGVKSRSNGGQRTIRLANWKKSARSKATSSRAGFWNGNFPANAK